MKAASGKMAKKGNHGNWGIAQSDTQPQQACYMKVARRNSHSKFSAEKFPSFLKHSVSFFLLLSCIDLSLFLMTRFTSKRRINLVSQPVK